MPMALAIEPTTSCNLRCPECPSGLRKFTRATGMLAFPLFKKLVDENNKNLLRLTFYFQGEPFLNPEFLSMAAYSVKQGVYTGTSTNAHYLNEETAQKTIESGIHELVISLDGAEQSTYEKYRIGGEFEKVKSGVANVLKARKRGNSHYPKVILQCIVFKHNEHELETMKLLAKSWNVDELQLKTAQIYNPEENNDRIPLNEKFSRYRLNKDGKWQIKNKLLNQCWRMWSSCVITWNGKMVPCCFDKDAKYTMGDVNQQTLKHVWKSQTYNNFRQNILKSRSSIDICSNCTEGTKVFERE
jgi:radical SAM protein with 4Fe4S-binding SPASM domain